MLGNSYSKIINDLYSYNYSALCKRKKVIFKISLKEPVQKIKSYNVENDVILQIYTYNKVSAPIKNSFYKKKPVTA